MISVYAGKNSFLINKTLNNLKSDFLNNFGEMSVEELDGEETTFSLLIGAVQATPFLSPEKLVIVKDLARNPDIVEKIDQIFLAAKSGNDLVMIENDIDKRSKYYKFLKKNADFYELNELAEPELSSWLVKEAGSKKAELNRSDANYLVQRIGQNQQLLSKELQKLITYDKNITRENINKLTTERPLSTIFNLLDAAFNGNTAQTLRIYEDQRSEGAEPQSIFGMIIWQVNIVAIAASAPKASADELSARTGINSYSINKAQRILQKVGTKGVEQLLDRLETIDKMLKTKPVSPDDLIKNLLLSVSR